MYIDEDNIGKKYQTVVPLQIRTTAGIRKSKTECLADLNQRAYGTIDHVDEHLKKEKTSWNK